MDGDIYITQKIIAWSDWFWLLSFSSQTFVIFNFNMMLLINVK